MFNSKIEKTILTDNTVKHKQKSTENKPESNLRYPQEMIKFREKQTSKIGGAGIPEAL